MNNFRLQVLTAAGFLVLMVFSLLGNTAFAAPAAPLPKADAQAHKQKPAVRGPLDMADGQIKDVSCKGRALNMVFNAYDEILHLYTDNYFKVKFSAINFTPKGIMNPCKQAKGMYARVYFYDIKGHPHQGILKSVEFRE